MRYPTWSDPAQSGSRQEEKVSSPLAAPESEGAQRLSLLDAFGGRREGIVLRTARWDDSIAADFQRTGGDFCIVILSEPLLEPVRPPPGTVVCAPAQAEKGSTAVREAAATYQYQLQGPQRLLTAAEVKLLSEGKLYAATELRTTPDLVFRSGKPRLELLAQDLLTCEALAGYLGPLAVALSAPSAPEQRSPQELMAALRRLFDDAEAAVRGLDCDVGPEAASALDRLRRLSTAGDLDSFLGEAHRLYPQVPVLLEEVYLLRALAERPSDALEVLEMRAFVSEAALPVDDHDLALDKAIVKEQIQFASIVPEPQRLNTARLALAHFRQSYSRRYEGHHRAYWMEMARLHGRLLQAKGQAEVLRKLNTLTELGPPVGEGALEAYNDLLNRTSTCSLIVGVEGELGDAPICPACGLRLDQEPPAERVSETLRRIERAIQRQMARLSSVAVRQVLERSDDARVERFLKVVQAVQLASLPEILDDDLVGYLRRFLVEARIGLVMGPILSRLEEGAPPNVEEAQEALRELARVLQRAFRASGRALPPARLGLEDGASKKPKH